LNLLFNTTTITRTNVSTRPTLRSKPRPVVTCSAIFRTHEGRLAAAHNRFNGELAPMTSGQRTHGRTNYAQKYRKRVINLIDFLLR
jgi:hypothetical protein